MTKKEQSGEHILVCISPSPSNPKVIAAAAKMANAFHDTLTAIYIKPTNYETLPNKDKNRLQNNIEYARQQGASITTIIGDDIPSQVAEFTHISGVNKIVIGRSSINRQHFWNKSQLTEQIILNCPDVDIYIIPDSIADIKEHHQKIRSRTKDHPLVKDLFLTILLLALSTGIGLLFARLGFSEANNITVFILGILMISVLTSHPLYSVFASLAAVLLFNWFFIEPLFTFHTYETEYAVTFAIMLTSSLITGTLANRMKKSAGQSALEAFRTKILLDTNQLLQKAEQTDEVIEITASQIIMLLNRDVVIYPANKDNILLKGIYFPSPHLEGTIISDPDEKEIAERLYKGKTEPEKNTLSQYYPISLNDHCYGVVVIHTNKSSLEPYENSILMSMIGECSLALENLRHASEKEQASLIARNEQLRSNLLRSLSHDIRTPLTSISGNADTLLSHYQDLDENTLKQIFSDIYDDSEWLIDMVENLLSISRIENGNMQLHMSLEILSDVIAEAMKHIDRNAKQHKIIVENEEDLLLVNMDGRFIMQVLINLINNAVKNTPEGSTIQILSKKEGTNAIIKVTDNGPGIPDSMKPHIFDMFYTGRNKVADGRRGLGLGLALCKSIIEAHRGKITLSDNQPSGCCFTISLPIKEVTINE